MRELICKKLSGKARRDLDEISSRIGIQLISCRRQFDNFFKIAKSLEESPFDILGVIRRNFLISEELGKKYTAAVFLNYHQIDTHSTSFLRALTLRDLGKCAFAMIENWTINGSSLHFDPSIAQDLRDISLDHFLTDYGSAARIGFETKDFHRRIRNVIKMGCGLAYSREVKDIIRDIVELGCESNDHAGSGTGNVSCLIETIYAFRLTSELTKRHDTNLKRFIAGLAEVVKALGLAPAYFSLLSPVSQGSLG